MVFISRCQNLKGEGNDQPWAGKINDGSFIYSAAAGGQTKADTLPNGGLADNVEFDKNTFAPYKNTVQMTKMMFLDGATLDFIDGLEQRVPSAGLHQVHSRWQCVQIGSFIWHNPSSTAT